MNPIRNYLDTLEGALSIDGAFAADAAAGRLCWTADPQSLPVVLPAGASAQIVVLHETPGASALRVSLGEGARLELTELFLTEGAAAETEVEQAAGSDCRIATLLLTGAEASYRMALAGRNAACTLHGLFLAGGEERCTVRLRTEHRVADCRSESLVKGVAGGAAVGTFAGLVYVAPDAQRTDAQQQSRNVLLNGTARIDTQPQLEIYADDVKCTHGATVGQMDEEAILYMRQRGLSEAQARRLQIGGFVADIVGRCPVEPLREVLAELVGQKMERM